MNTDIPKISDSEYEIMKIIWERNPIKSNEIVSLVNPENNWSEKTIKTLISRLLNKSVIGFEKDGKNYLYYPLIDKKEYIACENKSFIKKFYNNSLGSMFLNFIKDMDLSKKDINELRDLLNEENIDD